MKPVSGIRFGPSGDWPSGGNRSSGGERLQRAQAFGPNSHRFSPNDDGNIHIPTVMQRNVAVKEFGPGGVKFDPSGSAAIGPSGVGSQTTTTAPAAIEPSDTNGRKALSISPSGTGDDHPAQLIVRTQKRLEAPQVGLRLDNEARR